MGGLELRCACLCLLRAVTMLDLKSPLSCAEMVCEGALLARHPFYFIPDLFSMLAVCLLKDCPVKAYLPFCDAGFGFLRIRKLEMTITCRCLFTYWVY